MPACTNTGHAFWGRLILLIHPPSTVFTDSTSLPFLKLVTTSENTWPKFAGSNFTFLQSVFFPESQVQMVTADTSPKYAISREKINGYKSPGSPISPVSPIVLNIFRDVRSPVYRGGMNQYSLGLVNCCLGAWNHDCSRAYSFVGKSPSETLALSPSQMVEKESWRALLRRGSEAVGIRRECTRVDE